MTTTNWARQRKFLYTSITVGTLVFILGIVSFRIFYEPPTCFDGKKNGSETGVDCGGNCLRVCESEALPLTVKWEKFFKIREGVYSAVAYIENANLAVGVESFPYEFEFFNSQGNLIGKVSGKSYSEPYTGFPVFEGPISLNEEPDRVEFSFVGSPYLVRAERAEIPIKVNNATLMSSETKPKIQALLTNESIETVRHVEAVALVFDGSGEVVAASRTVVPELPRDSRERITFTWPEAFRPEQEACVMPSTIVLAIDRSGSMQFDSENPPQPLTDALLAAQTFVSNLSPSDFIGVVSYGTESTIDMSISHDKDSALKVIGNTLILPEDIRGYTNIGAAIKNAHNEIMANIDKNPERNVIILLTDGVANQPQDPGGEVYAESQAELAKRDNITIYTIGLGDNINRESLTSIATAPNYYFEAVTAEDLFGIYEEIGSAVCTHGPSIVEITPRYSNVSTNR